MAFDNLLTRIIAQIAKSEAKKDLLSQYGPPSHDDILHDGLVGAGETWGGVLGTAAGVMGGEAEGGPPGALAGGFALGPTGALAGGWAAHGAYLGGQLIRDILSRPENWTVNAAGAIVPIPQGPALPSNSNGSMGAGAQYPRSGPVGNTYKSPSNVFDTGAPPTPFVPPASQNAPGGIPGLMSEIGAIDPSNPDWPPPGGLPGLMLEYLRNDPNN
jgi:hypothetical protein